MYQEWVPEGVVKPPVQKNPLPTSGNVYGFVYDLQVCDSNDSVQTVVDAVRCIRCCAGAWTRSEPGLPGGKHAVPCPAVM